MLREYQQRTIDQLYAWFEAGHHGNPCLVLPTGSEMCSLGDEYVEELRKTFDARIER